MARFLACYLCFILMTAASMLAEAQPTRPARKLGKHTLVLQGKISATATSPAEPPKGEENGVFSGEVSASGEEPGGEEVMRSNHHHHHHRSIDKSVAGGGVILGGLATTFLVAIFCYIRATGRRGVEPAPGSPTNSDSSLGKNINGEAAASPTHSSISISHQK
ncbi:hypothetical protein Salat_0995500 [Sesamum alatum]|uniref:Uncharacterized protein n=1 Tax=Sesamum alatum TaxID=300844 RepID=A0AAE2CSA6_9LAMI|nr:hypothetical protein Salat_0995500 [Sesamum alatum]